jgi:hypothetical protein
MWRADQHWLTVAAQLFVHSYGLTGHTFGPASAYTSLALFNLLRMPLAFLPIMITSCINALVALTRIGDFLQKPESGLDSLRKAAEQTPAGDVKVGGLLHVVLILQQENVQKLFGKVGGVGGGFTLEFRTACARRVKARRQDMSRYGCMQQVACILHVPMFHMGHVVL